MSMNSGGGGRAGRGPALNLLVEGAKRKRTKQHQKAYDQHEYDEATRTTWRLQRLRLQIWPLSLGT